MALVNRIINFSCVDGPGNRMVIFFQGCNFACTYCHNPETINKCLHCGRCVRVCPAGALQIKQGKVIWDDAKCIKCDNCIRECPHLASPKTNEYSSDELLKIIIDAKAFISGITVSGGECTLNSDFLVELFKKVKEETNLTCFVDTNGSVDLSLYEELVELTDGFMLDVKSIDANEHIKLTGSDNHTVIKNLHLLLQKNKLYEVRTVVAPGLSCEATIAAVSKIIRDRCIYKLIKYRKYGVRKKGLEFHGEAGPSDDIMEELASTARKNGAVNVVIT